MSFDEKVSYFFTALTDMYKDEDNKESCMLPKLELTNDTITDDFTAMFYAIYIMYKRITDDDTDAIGFSHICNRLVMQHIMEENEEEN